MVLIKIVIKIVREAVKTGALRSLSRPGRTCDQIDAVSSCK
jgi:hypothetical protein